PPGARTMQRNGGRPPTSGNATFSLHRHPCKRARELEGEAVEADVRDEQVGAKTDRGDRKAAFLREPQGVLQLLERFGSCKRTRGAAGSERGEPREGNV